MTSISLPDSALAASHITRRFVASSLEAWENAIEIGTRYWARAAARRATPFDLAADSLRWLELVSTRRAPTWSTPNELVESSPLALLRRFGASRTGARIPTLILPPQAGHHSCIVDFAAGQSQVRTALAAGLEDVNVLEWLGATQETKDASIGDYLACVASAIERIGGPVHLVGDCQGGWLAAIYAALEPADTVTLTIAGAPIDTHAGDSAIADYVRLGGGLTPFRLAVELNGGVFPGEAMLGGFVALQPETELAAHLELALHLDDDAYVRRHTEFRDWYEHTQPIPGALYLWAVEHLFLGNELARGTLTLGGRPVSLAEIRCPVVMLGGAKDHITPPGQVFALADRVSTAPGELATVLVDGGHLGLFMGHDALETAWRPHFERLAAA